MRMTVQGEGGGGGFGNAYYRAYVNRYYSGVGCQDVGPAVAIGRGSSGKPHHHICLLGLSTGLMPYLKGTIGAHAFSALGRRKL